MLIGAVLGTASCKKYLSPEPVSYFEPAIAFGNIPNAKASLMGAYLALAGDNGYGIRTSYYYPYDDDNIMGGGAGLDLSRQQIAHYTLQAGNADIVNTFYQFYAGIERANNCIYYIPLMPLYTSGSATDQAELKRMHGEALVLRAQYYFELIRHWGDIPEQRLPSALMQDLFLPRTSRDTIYSHLLNDLLQAKDLMPWRTAVPQDERFTKGTAMALRAKIALFAGGYSLRGQGSATGTMERPSNYPDFYKIARDECAELMANRNEHDLLPSYKSIWKDFILAHKAADAKGEIMMQAAMANGNNSDSRLGIQNGIRMNGVGGSFGFVLPTYFYQFDSTDVRRDVTIAPYEVVRDVYGRGHNSNAIYDGKFRKDWVSNPYFTFSSGATTGTNPVTLTPASNTGLAGMQLNWPMIRFSDVLLMYAEAANEINGSPTAAAMAAFREVSQRGHGGNAALVPSIPADKDGFFKLIVKERSLEFGGEGIRKYDLIRWNLLGTALSETKANLVKMAAGTALGNYSYMAPMPAYTLTSILPRNMYYYQNAPAEDGKIWAHSFYVTTPTLAPLDPTNGNIRLTTTNRISWFANAGITATFVNFYAAGFKPGVSELFPVPTNVLEANPRLRPNNPGY